MDKVISNEDAARVFFEIAEYLAMQNIPFRPRAYQKVAEAILGLEEQIRDMYAKGGIKALEEIPGVGASSAEKLEELIKTGRLKYYESLKKETPVDLTSLTRVQGLGPKSIQLLYAKLGVKNLDDLERAAKKGKIRNLPRFGPKAEENILKGIEFARNSGARFILGFVMPEIRSIEVRLKERKEVEEAVVAGSARRRKETIGDVDILVISDHPAKVMEYVTTMPEVVRVYAKGETKSSVRLKSGPNLDVRVVPKASYGAALNYFTGSKDHNIALRKIAIEKGYKLNEYGLFTDRSGKGREKTKTDAMVAGGNEEEIYKALGLQYIEPEMRENNGEIDLARKKKLPSLIGYDDIMGDLQVQTNWTDGAASIEEMANAAKKAGLQYIAITDHTKRLTVTNGLDEKRILKQMAEIDRLNKKLGKSFTILKGTECDILKDGSLDLPDHILAELDVVGVSVHSYFNLTKEEQTQRMVRAIENPHADILFHPTGRLINKRSPYQVDMEEIMKTAKRTGTVLEVNSYPDRLDLNDDYVRMAVAQGIKLSIDSDAHNPAHFSLLEHGIAQARRGWAEKKDVINAWPVEKMRRFLK